VTEGPPRDPSTARACPSCGEAMQREAYERKTVGRIELDLCFGCQAIWFDQYESAGLTPGAVMKLFEEIHERREARARPLADVCRCPVCRRTLQLTQDIERTNRISYYRCPESHGRLTTFYQFLREKNFVRSLSVAEIEKLKVVVTQVRCSSCGAPVNLERDAQCPFCRAPIAILDADAVKRVLAELSDDEQRRRAANPHAAVDALLAGQRYVRAPQYPPAPGSGQESAGGNPDVVDLVGEALDFLMHR
jgi:endogenous inhibitor of DNA gyrase (YacG/DUF329 family)